MVWAKFYRDNKSMQAIFQKRNFRFRGQGKTTTAELDL